MPPFEEWVEVPAKTVRRLWDGSRFRDGHCGEAVDNGDSTFTRFRTGEDLHTLNFRGDVAEAVYSLTTGLAMNESVRRGGFKGDDFPDGIDVKHTCFLHESTCLIVEPDLPPENRPKRGYALVALYFGEDGVIRGVVLGWASNEMVEFAPRRDYGYGPKPSIHHTELHRPPLWLKHGAWPQEELERRERACG
jgi:hypothetical protein